MTTYSVHSAGRIQAGLSEQIVKNKVAQLFNISADKANIFLKTERRIKKDLDLKTAQRYRQRLEQAGLVVELRQQELEAKAAAAALSLEPIEDKTSSKVSSTEVIEVYSFSCPKCLTPQVKSEQCTKCGVFFNKLPNANQTYSNKNIHTISKPAHVSESTHYAESNNTGAGKKALLAAAGVALLGAFIWKFLVVSIGYEFGLIAWIIGGAIGFTVSMFNVEGQNFGIICAVLAIAAILGGKYMAYESFKHDWTQEIVTDEGLEAIYKEQISSAYYFVNNVRDVGSLRRFMVDYGYTDSTNAGLVTQDEVKAFKEHEATYLKELAANPQNIKDLINDNSTQAMQAALLQEMQSYSSIDLIKENFGLLDALFILLGVATAFRLGSGVT